MIEKQKDTKICWESINWLELLLGLFLLCLFTYTAYLIFAKMNPYAIDSDVVSEISYRQLSWEQKTLFPQGFIHGSETFAGRPALFYWLFYGFTKNFLLAYQFELIFILIFNLCSVFFLLYSLKINRKIILFALCMFISWMPHEVSHNMFWPIDIFASYSILIFITCTFYIQFWKNYKKSSDLRKRIVLLPLIVLLLMSIWFGYTTIKMAVTLYIPLVCVDVLRLIFELIDHHTINKTSLFIAIVSFTALIFNLLGYGMCSVLHNNEFYPKTIDIAPISNALNWSVISSQLQCIIESLGIRGGGALGTISGIQFLISASFLILEIISVIWLFKKYGKKSASGEGELLWYWFSFSIIMFLIEISTAVEISITRYYFVTSLLLPVLCGLALNDWSRSDNGKFVQWPCIVLGLGVLSLFGTNFVLNKRIYSANPTELAQVAEYVKDNGYEYVTASYWNAGAIKGYTNGKVDYQHSSAEEGIASLTPYYWMIDKRKFDDERNGENSIFLLTDDEEAIVVNKYIDVRELLQDRAQKVMEIGQYNLYAFTENPYTMIKKYRENNSAGLPGLSIQQKVDTPDKYGFCYQNAVLNAAGELVSNGQAGFVLYGPYSDTVEGTYDITLHYVVNAFTQESRGLFDVALDTQSYAAIPFTASQTSVTLKNVTIDNGHVFEVRVQVPDGMIVCIKEINYLRNSA